MRLQTQHDIQLALQIEKSFVPFNCQPNRPVINILHGPKTITPYVGFEILTAVVMKSSIFWDIMLKVNWHFGGTYRLYLQGRKISWARNQRESRWQADLPGSAVCWVSTDISEEHIASLLRVKKIGWANNQCGCTGVNKPWHTMCFSNLLVLYDGYWESNLRLFLAINVGAGESSHMWGSVIWLTAL
jgi:hypothetical protein